MRKTASLPMPTINDAPERKDRSGTFILAIVLILVIALIFM